MASLNKVFLIGNLTKDPELRYTPNGIAVVNLRLAVNRKYKDRNGENKEEVCFMTVTAWDRQAEVCNQYLKKGRPVFVEGRLQTRSWEAANGEKRSIMDVRAERIQFLGAAGGAGASRDAEPVYPESHDAPPAEQPASEESKPETVSWDEEENVV